MEEFFGVVGVSAEVVALGGEEGGEGLRLHFARGAGEGLSVGVCDAVGIGVGGGGEEVGGEGASGFDEGWIVEEGECLLGSIGDGAGAGGFFAGGGVEIRVHGIEEGALPVGVEAAAELALIAIGGVFALGELEGFVVAGWLVGKGAGAADFGVQQARDGDGVIADSASRRRGFWEARSRFSGSLSRSSG